MRPASDQPITNVKEADDNNKEPSPQGAKPGDGKPTGKQPEGSKKTVPESPRKGKDTKGPENPRKTKDSGEPGGQKKQKDEPVQGAKELNKPVVNPGDDLPK